MSRRLWSFMQPTGTDFNELADRLDWADEATDGMAGNIRKLFELDREQEREIAQLRAVVEELTGLLVASGLVDEATLKARVHERLSAVPAAEPAQDTVRCASCATAVPRADTYFSDLGEVCSICFSG